MLYSLLFSLASPDVDALFKSIDRSDTPGCALDVRRTGFPMLRRAYGRADLETGRPIDPDTIFEAGSVSKQFTAALVTRLAEQRRLSLDDNIRRWLPELPMLYEGITIEMLLHHTSGIRDWSALADLTGWPRGTRAYALDDAIALVARQTALNIVPGTEFLYSNSNYLLLARVAERAGGRPFGALARAELFDPLGMTRTRWRTDFRDVVPGRAQAYSPDGTGGWQLDMPFEDVVGPGGLLTTVGDLQRWNAALADPRNSWAVDMRQAGTLVDGTRVSYGLGLELGPVAGRPAFSHAGSTAGYRAWLGRFPEDGLSVALLCNAGSIDTEEIGPRLAALFLPDTRPDRVPKPLKRLGRGAPRGIAGAYRNAATDSMVTITDTGGVLGIGDSRYRPVGQDRFETESGRRAMLVRDRGGDVLAIDVTRPGNAPVRLLPAQPWAPDSTAMEAIAGRYSSADSEGEHRLIVKAGVLVWIDPRGTEHALRATITDGFRALAFGWTLQIAREGTGAVTGFRATTTRARRIAFNRLAD